MLCVWGGASKQVLPAQLPRVAHVLAALALFLKNVFCKQLAAGAVSTPANTRSLNSQLTANTNTNTNTALPQDDGIRPDATVESLGQLKAVFKRDGTTTAGNSSQVTDGAAAVLLMTRAEALRRRLPVLGVFRSFAAVGVDPSIMGVGPAVAIPAALKLAGVGVDDIDVYEINEAFASQVRRVAGLG